MSLRYLTENNDYVIKYNPNPYIKSFHSPIMHLIWAYLSDKNKNIFITDSEKYNGKLEPCLMKLGKRLQKRWRNRKK